MAEVDSQSSRRRLRLGQLTLVLAAIAIYYKTFAIETNSELDARRPVQFQLAESVVSPTSQPQLALSFSELGCFQISPDDLLEGLVRDVNLTPLKCAQHCASRDATYFVLTVGDRCGCMPTEVTIDGPQSPRCNVPCGGETSIPCGGRGWWINLYHISTPLKESIVLYIAPARRTSSLYSTGRFARFFDPKYTYVKKSLNNMVARNVDVWYQEVCVKHPGKKILIQIAGGLEFVLSNFPENSVLVILADENGDWGLSHNDKAIGPHGAGGTFKTNTSHALGHIILPPQILPFFRQYYDARQIAAFGANVDFIPLGSRVEYPDIELSTSKPASQRFSPFCS
jgi:hypothetical protein